MVERASGVKGIVHVPESQFALGETANAPALNQPRPMTRRRLGEESDLGPPPAKPARKQKAKETVPSEGSNTFSACLSASAQVHGVSKRGGRRQAQRLPSNQPSLATRVDVFDEGVDVENVVEREIAFGNEQPCSQASV